MPFLLVTAKKRRASRHLLKGAGGCAATVGAETCASRMRGSRLDTRQLADHRHAPAVGADDLRVASFVASNGVLRMGALCTVFIVTCTGGLGAHGDTDEFGTRNA